MLVLVRFGLDLSLGLARRVSNAHSSYWLVLNARFTWATSRDLSSGFVTRTSALFRSAFVFDVMIRFEVQVLVGVGWFSVHGDMSFCRRH